MNKYLDNKIITSVSKFVKKSINEAYDTSSIYDNNIVFQSDCSSIIYMLLYLLYLLVINITNE